MKMSVLPCMVRLWSSFLAAFSSCLVIRVLRSAFFFSCGCYGARICDDSRRKIGLCFREGLLTDICGCS
jgi:hypothetical protein